MDTLMDGVEMDVVIDTVTFHAPDTGYTVAKATVSGTDHDGVTLVGNMVDPQPGLSLRLTGSWTKHPQYGEQFKISGYVNVAPGDPAAIQAFLGSGIIKGIGPGLAATIVAKFGRDTLNIFDTDPQALLGVSGIGPKTLAKITESYGKQRGIQELMLVLAKAGIPSGLAARIHKHFEDKACWVVQNAPYQLTAVSGIGFTTADAVARKIGIDRADPERLKAGLVHVLEEAASSGHCFLPRAELITESVALLGVGTDMVVEAYFEVCSTRVDGDTVIIDDEAERSWLPVMWHTEVGIVDRLDRLTATDSDRLVKFSEFSQTDWNDRFAESTLAPEQADAVRAALQHRVSVLTGGPGCGKTYTLNTAVALAQEAGYAVALAAPTGRAAKRMTEQTGVAASTIHRMLNIQHDDDDFEELLSADLFIIDESSMLDVHLALKLLRAIPDGAHIVFVGDEDQLPSVGPGKFLADLIASDLVPVTRLTHVFRQAAASGIVSVAHAVNHGHLGANAFDGFDDIYWWNVPAETMTNKIINMITERIPIKFGLATDDIQVLAPMKKGDSGVDNLNLRLQETLNPHRDDAFEQKVGDRVFRVGDRVMQTRNNYDKNIFNGTGASIESIRDVEGDKVITITTDDGEKIDYEPSELSQLMHAYAITIHKSQGSEYPAVVIPLTTASWVMLKRNLLYTAITRAKHLVVLMGDQRALTRAVNTIDTSKRYTGLAERLRQ